MGLVALVGMFGCYTAVDTPRKQRVWEMQDHEAAALAARDAIARDDLVTMRLAGEDLARPDPVPGLPEAGRAPLDAVRAGGRALAEAPDRATGAQVLVEITASCASCHTSLGVAEVRPLEDVPVNALWTALIFESEARWSSATAGLAAEAPGLATPSRWDERRKAVAALLAEGKLGAG